MTPNNTNIPQQLVSVDDRNSGLVTVRFQAAKILLTDGGYQVIPRTSVETTVELPAYRMAGHLERHIAEQYPGLTLVDWEIK
jgi:hypothetical protein